MSEEQQPLGPVSLTVKKDEFRNMIIRNVLDILKSVKLSMLQTQSFAPRDVVDVLKSLPEKDLLEQLKEEIASSLRIAKKISEEEAAKVKKFTEDLMKLMNDILDNPNCLVSTMLKDYMDIMKLKREFSKHPPFPNNSLDDKFKLKADDSTGSITMTAEGKVSPTMHKAITDDIHATEYLALVSDMLSNLRKLQQKPQLEEYVAIQFAYHLLAKGYIMPHSYQWLGLPGTRNYTQTYLFITDPGPGNIKVTCQDPELMKGVVVHTEHIDRGDIKDKSLVEAYRIPAHVNAAKVRLHVGADAPCCAFIGRPVFEGVGHESKFVDDALDGFDLFQINLLKSAHMTASACTAMFINGIAECKIAIEKMSKDQAIEFMRSVKANTIRNSQWQFFSAAFNLFTPIKVDSDCIVKDKLEIARLAIEITKEGGFEKVTWDGAEDGKVPSDPITETLGHENLVQLVHEAHEKGLICYVSAGIEDEHVPDAVITGVDGIGIGTWLHYRDEKGMGELKPENIKAVLKKRDTAAQTPCGRAAATLARLDYQYYEKSIDESCNELRLELLGALKSKDEAKINELLEQYQSKNRADYPQHDHHMYNRGISLHRAYNLLATKKPLAAKSFSENAWKGILEMISASCDALNHTALENVMVHIDRQISKE